MGATIPPWRPPVTPGGTLNGQSTLREQQETIAAASTAIPIAYGEVMVGGRVFAASYSGGYWTIGALFCVGEIDSFTNLYLNDAAPVSGVSVNYYTGTTTQAADPLLAAAISGYADTLVMSTPQGSVGIAYVVIQYTDAHYSGFPSIKARLKGRKVSPIGSNLLTYSEQLSNTSGWTQQANADVDVTADAVAAPDGATTADKVIEASTANVTRFIRQIPSATFADYAVVCFSAYLKAAERNARLVIVTKSGGSAALNVDMSTGSVLSASGADLKGYGVQDVGGGWYRAWVVGSLSTGGTSPQFRIQMMSGSNTTYTGVVGNGFYAWGAQLEVATSPGVYAATTASATAKAWSDNPALCLRDLISCQACGLGETVDDLSAQVVAAECDAVVIAEKRRRMSLLIDNPRAADDWISTLSTYAGCWTFKRGGRWVMVADRPALVYQFTSSADGWTAVNGAISTAGLSYITLTPSAADAYIRSPSGLLICGNRHYRVRARISRVSGSGAWDGTLYYTTSWHGESATYRHVIASPGVPNGTWTTVEWDMRVPTAGGQDWLSSVITRIRLDFFAGASDVVYVDWISIGVVPITTDDVLADSVSVSVADTLQAPTVVVATYTDTSVTPWRERQAEAVLSGVSTGTVPRRESQISLPGVFSYSQAYREAAERLLKLQRTTQVEGTLFDEGLELEQGDIVSITHPYLNTSSAAEADSSTLYRLVEPPAVVSPGRVKFAAVAYSAADYDNTEPSVTWGAAPTLLGALDVGRSGDGVNRIPARFAGGWANPDYDGQLPVTKGANIDYAAVCYGSGSDPTAGYYGAHCLKVDTATSGTDRIVWFGSSSTAYNFPIDPRSKWLFSCKYWPLAGNTSVTFTLKTSGGTSYTLTDTTNSATSWNDFVHTATGSNLIDCSADTSDRALFGLTVAATDTRVWFDGLMLEKQIANGAVVSPWRPPLASNTNGGRVGARQVAPGMLEDNIEISDGAGNARTVAKGILTGVCKDGDAITFSPAFGTVPTVIFQPGGLTASSSWSANNYSLVCEARSLTTSGFTAYIKLRQTAGTLTARTDTTPTDEGSTALPRYTIHKSQASESFDDKYTFQFDCTVVNTPSDEPDVDYLPGWVDVGIYVAKSSGVWELVKVRRVNGSSGASASVTRSNLTQTVTVDGLGQHAGKEFGIGIYGELVSGGSITFDQVTYSTASAPTETDATAGGVSAVPYMVIAG